MSTAQSRTLWDQEETESDPESVLGHPSVLNVGVKFYAVTCPVHALGSSPLPATPKVTIYTESTSWRSHSLDPGELQLIYPSENKLN